MATLILRDTHRALEEKMKSLYNIKKDIEKCVDEFYLKGSISYHINHPTNTCDPYTGNWAEHLMDYKWLRQIIKNSGFSVEIMTGRFDSNGPLHKKIIKNLA
jgi:hypothetical protein